MKGREILSELFGKTRAQRWYEASPAGKRIYIVVVVFIFALIASVWTFGAWWQ
ncbi:hypothetical protein RJO15_21525 [Herbaspirillum huttiense F1]|uniref:hypothetical protein n=1 Tax=Herbaspirillum huttiense TaxID=863372 RepID=UPI002885C436|nr:hypothetical protein [Herbaspirillum huttiense]MDT0358382.1 hypothetical protein [Herbaspirillum huttiense F1]